MTQTGDKAAVPHTESRANVSQTQSPRGRACARGGRVAGLGHSLSTGGQTASRAAHAGTQRPSGSLSSGKTRLVIAGRQTNIAADATAAAG